MVLLNFEVVFVFTSTLLRISSVLGTVLLIQFVEQVAVAELLRADYELETLVYIGA